MIANKKYRSGTITHEAMMAIVMATAVLMGTAQLLAIISHQRRAMRHEAVARRELGNVMEEIAARDWDDVTDEKLSVLELSNQCRETLREPRLRIHVTPDADQIGRRVLLEIDWLTIQEVRAMPMRLSAWRYPNKETNR